MAQEISVALVYTPYHRFDKYRKGGAHPPNGLRILGGELLERNLADRVKIFDGNFYDDLQSLIKDIYEFNPLVLGVSCFTDSMPETIEILRSIKGKRIKIAGGPYATGRPYELLEHVDVVFYGESEVSIRDFFTLLRQYKCSYDDLDIQKIDMGSVRGIIYKRGDTIQFNPPPMLLGSEDLDNLSLKGWDLLKDYLHGYKIANYRHLSQNFNSILSSRGCTGSCVFCSSGKMHGRRFRFRSTESVEREIDYINQLRVEVGLPPLESIKFDDDDFFARDINSFRKMVEMLKRKKLTYTCFASIKYMSKEKIRLAAETGLKSVFIGIETHEGNRERVGKVGLFGKAITDAEIIDVCEMFRQYGVRTAGGYIIGFPWETREDMWKTVDTMVTLPIDYPSITILTLHPEIPIWEWIIKHINLFPDLKEKPFTHVDRERWPEEPVGLPCPHPYVSKKELRDIKREAYIRAYSDENRIERLFEMTRNPEEVQQTVAALRDYMYEIKDDERIQKILTRLNDYLKNN